MRESLSDRRSRQSSPDIVDKCRASFDRREQPQSTQIGDCSREDGEEHRGDLRVCRVSDEWRSLIQHLRDLTCQLK
jgi:hypothetical protein